MHEPALQPSLLPALQSGLPYEVVHGEGGTLELRVADRRAQRALLGAIIGFGLVALVHGFVVWRSPSPGPGPLWGWVLSELGLGVLLGGFAFRNASKARAWSPLLRWDPRTGLLSMNAGRTALKRELIAGVAAKIRPVDGLLDGWDDVPSLTVLEISMVDGGELLAVAAHLNHSNAVQLRAAAEELATALESHRHGPPTPASPAA